MTDLKIYGMPRFCSLPCDEVVIAIPYENDLARKAHKEIESVGGRIIGVKALPNYLTQKETL